MLLLALFANLLAADDFRVEACPHPLNVAVEASEPLFAGKHTTTGVVCGTGIEMVYFDPERGKRAGRLSVEYTDATQVRVVVEDVRRRLRIERGGVPLDTPTELAVNKGRHTLTARVTVSAAPPQPGVVSIRASNKSHSAVVDHAAAASGWTVRGTDVLKHCRTSSAIDAIAMRFLLQIVAVECAVDMVFVGDAEAVFSRPRSR